MSQEPADFKLNPFVKGTSPLAKLTFTCRHCDRKDLLSFELTSHAQSHHLGEYRIDARIYEVEPEIKPIPSGQILVFKQYLDEELGYIIECERCPDVTLGPTEMGGHAVTVHLRSSFHVETGGAPIHDPVVHPVPGLPWWGQDYNLNQAAAIQHPEFYPCCRAIRGQEHSIMCGSRHD